MPATLQPYNQFPYAHDCFKLSQGLCACDLSAARIAAAHSACFKLLQGLCACDFCAYSFPLMIDAVFSYCRGFVPATMITMRPLPTSSVCFQPLRGLCICDQSVSCTGQTHHLRIAWVVLVRIPVSCAPNSKAKPGYLSTRFARWTMPPHTIILRPQ